MVHAEMAALINAGKCGISVQGATMYCTTFPCHMCARHIVAAGISRVVYVEPYPKSMAARLYPDSIIVGSGGSGAGAGVHFQAFAGISSRSYVRLFEMRKRKDAKGNALFWKESAGVPRVEQIIESYILVETRVLEALKKELDRLGIKEATQGVSQDGAGRVVDETAGKG